jgi:hypothetical protein
MLKAIIALSNALLLYTRQATRGRFHLAIQYCRWDFMGALDAASVE